MERGHSDSLRPTLCSARRADGVAAPVGAVRTGPFRHSRHLLIVAGIGSATPAGAAGILPPSNPPANIAPSSSDWLTSIDAARADEGVGPMEVEESVLDSLPVPEQLFVVLNDERVDRGLPPIEYMSAQLNAVAAQSAASGDRRPAADRVVRRHRGDLRRRHLGRALLGARVGLPVDVRRRLGWRADLQRVVHAVVAFVLLDAPRHHLGRLPLVRSAASGALHGGGVRSGRLSGRVAGRRHREHLRRAE